MWTGLNLRGQEDLGERGPKGVDKRLRGKDGRRWQVKGASLWGGEQRGGDITWFWPCWGRGGQKGGRWGTPAPPCFVALHCLHIIAHQRMSLASRGPGRRRLSGKATLSQTCESLLVMGSCGPDCVQRGTLGHHGDLNPQSRGSKPRTREGRGLTWGHTACQQPRVPHLSFFALLLKPVLIELLLCSRYCPPLCMCFPIESYNSPGR